MWLAKQAAVTTQQDMTTQFPRADLLVGFGPSAQMHAIDAI